MKFSESMLQGRAPGSSLLLLNIWHYLRLRRKVQLICFLILMLANGFAELVSLGAILPFLSAITNPNLIRNNSIVAFILQPFHLRSDEELLVFTTVIFAVLILLAALTKLLTLWTSGRLAASIGSELSCQAYKISLYQPYQWHLNRNSSELIAISTLHISRTVVAISSFLQMIASLVAASFIFCGLFILSWRIALGSMLFFGTIYAFVSLKSSRVLKSNGDIFSQLSQKQIQYLQEGYGAIRDVILNNTRLHYINKFRKVDYKQRYLVASSQFISMYPRYAIEAVGLISFSIGACFFVASDNSNLSVIPILGTLALGAQKLLPTIQQIYGNYSKLKTLNADLKIVLNILHKSIPLSPDQKDNLAFDKSIRLERICFKYPTSSKRVLNGIDLTIQKGDCIGIIGGTGSGKSTLADIIMGILSPDSGHLYLDDIEISDKGFPGRVSAWQTKIAHVAQSIYLSDGTIAENIALGFNSENIDFKKVLIASKLAQLDKFINSLDQAYQSPVGERGVQLSGGQRQRIGLARALYKDAEVIILDEATSALDGATEDLVMSSIKKLGNNYTTIIIAHRLSTLNFCDRIIKLSSGKVVSSGPPSMMLTNSSL